jgi:hypothetical protein
LVFVVVPCCCCCSSSSSTPQTHHPSSYALPVVLQQQAWLSPHTHKESVPPRED